MLSVANIFGTYLVFERFAGGSGTLLEMSFAFLFGFTLDVELDLESVELFELELLSLSAPDRPSDLSISLSESLSACGRSGLVVPFVVGLETISSAELADSSSLESRTRSSLSSLEGMLDGPTQFYRGRFMLRYQFCTPI